MAFHFKKKKEDRNYLEMTPVRIHKHEMRDEKLVDVLVPRFSSKFAAEHLIPRMKNPYIKVLLDEFGSLVWLSIDGEKQVHEIADILEQEFGEKIQPVYNRLTLFLTQLYKSNFIYFKEIERK